MAWRLLYTGEVENKFKNSFLDARKYARVDAASPKEKGVGGAKGKDLFTVQ